MEEEGGEEEACEQDDYVELDEDEMDYTDESLGVKLGALATPSPHRPKPSTGELAKLPETECPPDSKQPAKPNVQTAAPPPMAAKASLDMSRAERLARIAVLKFLVSPSEVR